MHTTHVWYAAYGSSCDDARFDCYLAGGRPAGSTHHHRGCRDTTPPTAITVATLPYALYFGGWSPFWGGAVAYLDPIADPDVDTPAVARRITVDQFLDVVAQEGGGAATADDLDRARIRGRIDTGGAYGTILYGGDLDGEPVLTCSGATRRRAGAPTDAYVATIRRGLTRLYSADVVSRHLDAALAATTQPSLFDDTDDGWLLETADRWEDLDLDDLDDVVLDGERLDDRAAINHYLAQV